MKNKEPIIILIIMCVFSFASNAKSITVNNLIQTKGKIVVASAGGDLPLSRNQSDVVTNQIIDESTYYSINVDESTVKQELKTIPNNSITIAAEPVKSENLSVAPIITKTNLFDVINTDLSLREVLSRWAVEAKWTHNPEHWAVDRDFPIAGTADAKFFTADFKTAVRKLLTSTDVTDRPLQPCFYSNNVLRVISKSELCNRTKSF